MTPAKEIINNSTNEIRHRRIIMRADGFCRGYVSTKIIVRYMLETGSPIIPLAFLDIMLKDKELAEYRGFPLQVMNAMRNIRLSERALIVLNLQELSHRLQRHAQEQQQ